MTLPQTSPSQKEDALREIVTIARANGLILADIARAFREEKMQKTPEAGGVISRLLGYMGGIFVFAGICIFISMQWADMGSAARVIVTLGSGFSALVLGLVTQTEDKYERASQPLFLIANILQPFGLGVMLDEYGMGGSPQIGVLFIAGVMLVQQGALFIAKRRSMMAFFAICHGAIAFGTIANMLQIGANLTGITLGFSLITLAYALDRSRNRAIAPFWYFMGGFLLLSCSFDMLKHSAAEAIFAGIAAAMIYLSATVRSRALLSVSTLAMLGYIGYFTAEHFTNTLGWPISLVLIGLAFLMLGAIAVRINNKYIRGQDLPA